MRWTHIVLWIMFDAKTTRFLKVCLAWFVTPISYATYWYLHIMSRHGCVPGERATRRSNRFNQQSEWQYGRSPHLVTSVYPSITPPPYWHVIIQKILPKDRADMERYYLKLCTKDAASEEEIVKLHPRYLQLCDSKSITKGIMGGNWNRWITII